MQTVIRAIDSLYSLFLILFHKVEEILRAKYCFFFAYSHKYINFFSKKNVLSERYKRLCFFSFAIQN